MISRSALCCWEECVITAFIILSLPLLGCSHIDHASGEVKMFSDVHASFLLNWFHVEICGGEDCWKRERAETMRRCSRQTFSWKRLAYTAGFTFRSMCFLYVFINSVIWEWLKRWDNEEVSVRMINNEDDVLLLPHAVTSQLRITSIRDLQYVQMIVIFLKSAFETHHS